MKRAPLIAAALVSLGCALPWHRGEASAPAPPLVVPKRGEIVIAAWAEPRSLPRRGGQVQILVRVQRVGGGAYPGVQVQLRTDEGKLFSDGKALVTDDAGLTRDRLTSTRPAHVTVQVGDMRYRFEVPLVR